MSSPAPEKKWLRNTAQPLKLNLKTKWPFVQDDQPVLGDEEDGGLAKEADSQRSRQRFR